MKEDENTWINKPEKRKSFLFEIKYRNDNTHHCLFRSRLSDIINELNWIIFMVF
jgi:hypothetical protein